MALPNENPDGLLVFNSVIEKKQAELLVTTQRKLSEVNSTNIPSLDQRLQTIDAEASITRESGIFDVPSLEERLRSFDQGQKPQPVTSPLSVKFQQTGIEYMLNIPGSLAAGTGQLANVVLSAPQGILDFLHTTGVMKKSGSFYDTNYPQTKAARIAGQLVGVAASGAETLGGFIEDQTALLADTRETELLVEKVSKAYDDNTGAVAVAVAMAKTVATNPAAIPEIVATSLPIMLALAQKGGLFAMTFVGMTGQRMDDAIAVYKQTHDGRAPTGEDYNAIAIGAVIATSIETLESRFLLSKAARITKASAKKKSLLGIPGVRTGVATIEGAAAEAFEEGSAEYITQLTGQGDLSFAALTREAVTKPAAVAAAIGAGPGGAIKGGRQILPDTGKALKTGVKAVSERVEKAVTVDTEKRIRAAQEKGDTLEVVRLGMEKDISRLKTPTDRGKYIKYLMDKLDEADAKIRDMPVNEEQTKAAVEYNVLAAKLNTIIQAHRDLSKREQDQPTTLITEQAIQSGKLSSEEMIAAIDTVISDIQKGAEIQESTVKTILGSAQFDALNPDQKEVLGLVETVLETEKTARTTGTTKTLQDVAKDILTGSLKDRFIGTEQQRKIVANAIEFKDRAKANKSLKQLVALRQALLTKLKNAPVSKDGKEYKAHAKGFVTQLSAEIESITATLNLLDANVTTAFGKSPLITEQKATPVIELFGAKPKAKAAKKPTTKKKPTKTKPTKTEPVEKEVVPEPKIGIITNKVEVQKLIDGATNFIITENGEGDNFVSTVSAGKNITEVHEGTTVTLNKEENIAIRKLKVKLKNGLITRLEFRKQTHDVYRNVFKRAITIKKPDIQVLEQEREIDQVTNIEDVNIPARSIYAKLAKTYKTSILEADNILRAIKNIINECRI